MRLGRNGCAAAIMGAVIGLTGGCAPDLLHLEPLEQADITIGQLSARMDRAADPDHAFRNCKSYLMKQNLFLMHGGAKDFQSIEIRFQAPDKMRSVTFRSGKPTCIEIYNAGKAWRIDCATRKVTPIPPGLQLELFRLFIRQGTPSLSVTQIFKKVTIDMQFVEGVKVYRLICDPEIDGIAPYVKYVNGRTFLIEKMATVQYINGKKFLYVTIPADYAWYGDIRLPRTSTVTLMDATRISKLTEFKINVEFPASDFLPPVPFSQDRKSVV